MFSIIRRKDPFMLNLIIIYNYIREQLIDNKLIKLKYSIILNMIYNPIKE
jgi:hypothetical protein